MDECRSRTISDSASAGKFRNPKFLVNALGWLLLHTREILRPMSKFAFNPAIHLSIAWGVTLAIITLVEWNSLDRDPMREQIFTPFIQREISMTMGEEVANNIIDFESVEREAKTPTASTQTTVKFHFNGPLFLVCFFIPVLAFHGIGWLMARVK